MKVILYTKPECHLCDNALAVIERVRAQHGFDMAQVDITSDPELHQKFHERVPVVVVDGVEVFQFEVDEDALRTMALSANITVGTGAAPQKEHAV